MNSTTFINKLEIRLYSTLISVMSGIGRLKGRDQNYSKSPVQPITQVSADLTQITDQLPERAISINWSTVQQAFLSLLLWVILGFAAGFLIGMVNIR